MAKVNKDTIKAFHNKRNAFMNEMNDDQRGTTIGVWLDNISKQLTDLDILRYTQRIELKESRDGLIMLAEEIATKANLENPLLYARDIKTMESTRIFLNNLFERLINSKLNY